VGAFRGTDGSNPVPSSGESCELRYKTSRCGSPKPQIYERGLSPIRFGPDYSRKLADTHSLGSISYLDLGMFLVIEGAAKYPDTFALADLLTGIPNPLNAGLRVCGSPTVPLAGLARLARG
jgi:hypothetical protein